MNSKARRALSGEIMFPRFYGKEPKPLKPLTGEIISAGFDIEADAATAAPYLITGYLSNGKKFVKVLTDAIDALEFLTMPSFHDTINGFWNIAYDSEGILRFFPDSVKFLLSKNPEVYLRQDLSLGNKEDYFYRIRLIPKKCLTVSSLVSRENRFFDFAQFFGFQRLQTVAQRVLGKSKLDFDASESSIESFFNSEEYRQKAIKYCLFDSQLAAEIGQKLVTSIHRFLLTKNFTSCASIAEQYITRNGYYTPARFMNCYAEFLESYVGGRFELFMRGFIPDTHTYDLVSAYPWAMEQMQILTDDFDCTKVFDSANFNALYGAYQIDVLIDDAIMAPLPIQKQVIIYPTGTMRTWVDKETLKYLNEVGHEYRILNGYELYDNSAEKRLSKPIKELFAIKSNKDEDEGIRNSAKIILNSIYGKMIQLMDDAEGYLTSLDDALANNLNVDKVTAEGLFCIRHTGKFACGKMFNPAYASYVTAMTRMRLMRTADEVGHENVVALQTDSMTLRNEALKHTKVLGGWDYKGMYDLSVAKSGYYQFTDHTLMPANIIETKARSYSRLFNLAQEEISVKRRSTLKECATKGDFTTLNIIRERIIKNNLNTDMKRVWNAPMSKDDMKPGGRCITSKPINLNDEISEFTALA